MSHTLAIPATPQPVGRLALALTGYVITGADGVVFDGVTWPRPPWTLADAAGAVVPLPHDALPNWSLADIAVKRWRGQDFDALPFGLADEREQLRLKVESRLLECRIAENEARIAALNLPVDTDLSYLDGKLEAYGFAVKAYEAAVSEWADYDVEQMERAA